MRFDEQYVDDLQAQVRGLKAEKGLLKAQVKELEEENLKLRRALDLAGKRCEEVHHPKRYQHGTFDECPVEKLIEEVRGQG